MDPLTAGHKKIASAHRPCAFLGVAINCESVFLGSNFEWCTARKIIQVMYYQSEEQVESTVETLETCDVDLTDSCLLASSCSHRSRRPGHVLNA